MFNTEYYDIELFYKKEDNYYLYNKIDEIALDSSWRKDTNKIVIKLYCYEDLDFPSYTTSIYKLEWLVLYKYKGAQYYIDNIKLFKIALSKDMRGDPRITIQGLYNGSEEVPKIK